MDRLPTPEQVDEVVAQINRHLRGRGPLLQGAVLADLVAMYFAGHHPMMRDEAMDVWLKTMRNLIAPNEAALLELYGTPEGWKPS